MSTTQNPAQRDSIGKAVAGGLAAAVKKYYGKGPVSAKAHFLEGDILVVVMREPATTAESSLVKAGQPEKARDFRLAFQNEYAEELKSIVERETGRKVATYHSQIMFNPDMLFEIFVFGPGLEDDAGSDIRPPD